MLINNATFSALLNIEKKILGRYKQLALKRICYTWREENLEWDILYSDYLIWVSNGHTFDFLLKPFFLGYSREKSTTVFFKIRESLPFLYINLKWSAKFQIFRIHTHDSDWLNFIHFSECKYKIRLVSILRKREDQALISISTDKVFCSDERKFYFRSYEQF